jgi:hypothetical protein
VAGEVAEFAGAVDVVVAVKDMTVAGMDVNAET